MQRSIRKFEGVYMHRRLAASLLVITVACAPLGLSDEPATKQTVHDFSLVDINGKTVPLSIYKGKVLLIVNLASQSTYRDQIAALNDLEKQYAAEGLVVIGIPSSDFGDKELKDAAALREYYNNTAHVGFPLFAPAKLRGVNTIPLYSFLCDPKASVPGGNLHWNFTKFIIDREGKPLARYEVSEDPADVSFRVNIELALAGKLKKQLAREKDQTDDEDEN
ncbi:glutathione peroxidase [Telmatobacter sp. DSM 110680]|uniref:Glutathione peroxidase n=1 Tax=Telmatobacter sp. DSM 110680 TaxID=3036704 RepID=A0AAU7DNQ2_9BACT